MSKKTVKVAKRRLIDLFANMTTDLSCISTTNDSKAFAVNRLLTRMRKRAEIYNPELKTKAEDDFINLNSSLAEARIELPNDIADAARDFLRNLLTRAVKRRYPDSLQECFSNSWLFDNWAFGPGASNGIEGEGVLAKIHQPMSCTSQAEGWVRVLRRSNHYFQSYDALNGNDGVLIVPGSRLTTVLKNEEALRTIAIEPSGNMAFQLSGGRLIQAALSDIGLDITSQQPKNQVLARIGSKTGTVCTMDLKSASDMQVPDLIRTCWPSEWYDFFMRFRSPETTLPSGKRCVLNMISTMGNGYTFPMMTATILALVYANRLVNHNGPYRYVDFSQTAIFGDDIIVPTEEYESLSAVLRMGGYVVNHDKSFHIGPFRESCGGDFYEGVDVTPFYVRRLLQPADIYVAINQVLRWSSIHEVPMYRTLKFLFGLLVDKPYLVPEWFDDTSGVRTAQCARDFKFNRRKAVEIPYSGHFEMPLICGGYLGARARDGVLAGQPRSSWCQYKTGRSRLPQGYLDGWDPRYGTHRQSNYRSLMVALVG